MKRSGSYDYYLILATVGVLFAISSLCIYAMFAFKIAQVQAMDPALKAQFMARMNTIVAPFIIILVLLVGICVPNRLLPTTWLNRFAMLLLSLTLAVTMIWGIKTALLAVLLASLVLQLVVLGLACLGSDVLHFEKTGYWVRLGSSLMHLGVIMFILDLYFFRYPALHLWLFWITTVATVLGMTFCFYSEATVRVWKRLLPGKMGTTEVSAPEHSDG